MGLVEFSCNETNSARMGKASCVKNRHGLLAISALPKDLIFFNITILSLKPSSGQVKWSFDVEFIKDSRLSFFLIIVLSQ